MKNFSMGILGRFESKEMRDESKELGGEREKGGEGEMGRGRGLIIVWAKRLVKGRRKQSGNRQAFAGLWQVGTARGGEVKAKWEPPAFH